MLVVRDIRRWWNFHEPHFFTHFPANRQRLFFFFNFSKQPFFETMSDREPRQRIYGFSDTDDELEERYENVRDENYPQWKAQQDALYGPDDDDES